jgi:ACS family pantothenate transporter-like MFS transporter
MQYIIGSWYRKEELAKRSCIFHTSAAIATMFSGYLMTAVYHLDGRGGFRGWQWYVHAVQKGCCKVFV